MSRVLKIREVGDPVLSIKCEEVDINSINKEILEIIDDLKETLKFTEGFGIAAPQVGIDKNGFATKDMINKFNLKEL